MPAYNAGSWLDRSLPKLEDAIKHAKIKRVEIIIIDDGSTDNTVAVARKLKFSYPIRVITQQNSGRFLARARGVEAAKYRYLLFIDTRIYIGRDSLQYIANRLSPGKEVWTSHVNIERKHNPYARFWEGLTFLAWRRYFANPRECSYGIKDFDYYPKGTTCFFVPKPVIHQANEWFKNQTKNQKAANDDTLLIRRIAEEHRINLSPGFNCTYHARSSLKQFCKHVFHRGKVFVDGFLRRDGNRFFWPLIVFLVTSLLIPIGLLIRPQYLPVLAVAAVLVWVAELIAAIVLRVPYRDAFSLWLLSPLFVIVYGAGIWKAVFDIYVLRSGNRE